MIVGREVAPHSNACGAFSSPSAGTRTASKDAHCELQPCRCRCRGNLSVAFGSPASAHVSRHECRSKLAWRTVLSTSRFRRHLASGLLAWDSRAHGCVSRRARRSGVPRADRYRRRAQGRSSWSTAPAPGRARSPRASGDVTPWMTIAPQMVVSEPIPYRMKGVVDCEVGGRYLFRC